MPRNRTLTIKSPLGGKVANLDLQSQEPYTLYDCRDMWPISPTNSRARLAVRPGFAAAGSHAEVNMLATLAVAADSGSQESHLRQLMLAKDGYLYKNTSGVSFTAVSGPAQIDEGRTVHAVSYGSVLYIANSTYRKYAYDGACAPWTASVAGVLPPRCTMIACFSARIVLAGDPQNPHVVNFSRIDDPDDWDITAVDDGAAVTVPDINEPVTCLITHSQDCLIVGTYKSMWVFNGNPATNGTLSQFSHVVGPINSTAWCKDPNDNTYMLTRDGLYVMPAGCGTAPTLVSRDKIPESLLGLDGVNNKAYLEYDTRFQMVHIYVQGTDPQYFHFFPHTTSFWPVTSPGSGILAIMRYDPLETSDVSGVLIGTTSSMVRLDRTAALGGGTPAYATFAPISISNTPADKSKITDSVFTLGSETDDTTGYFDIHTAEDAESAAALPAGRKYRITIAKILSNRRLWPILAGHKVVLKYVQGSTSKKMSFEQCSLAVTGLGRERTAG